MQLIGGFLHLDGRLADPLRLDAMAAAMTESGLSPKVTKYVDGPVALLTLDFGSAPASPVRDANLILAADIRLDEPDDARDDAGLAALLAAQGEAGLARLSGDFAFAVWSKRDRTLLCARDGFGVRPFFFAHRPEELFVFASLPRGLHATGLVPRSIDRDYVVSELLSKFDGPARSLFKGVARLTPGGWLKVGGDRPMQTGFHWRLDPAIAGTRRIDPDDAAAELARLVEGAVRRRLPAAGPVATHLSGGVDSSAIAILAARMLRPANRKLLAYSQSPAVFGSYSFGGDGPFVAPVLRQEPDIVWRAMRIDDPAAFVFPKMDADQLFPVDFSHTDCRIFADAAANGASVLLSGWGGDEGASFTWRGVLAEALVTFRWRYLAAELHALGTARAAWAALSPFLLPPAVLTRMRAMAGRAAAPPSLSIQAASLLHAAQIAERSLTQKSLPPDARRIRFDLLTGLGLTRRAEIWTLLAARHGIAMCFPLLDRRVVEFALSLPSTLFVREGWSRRVFRDAMAGILPEELRWKPTKADIAAETPVYIAAQRARLAGQIAALHKRSVIADIFDIEAITSALDDLPAAEVLARTIETGGGDWAAVESAGNLARAFRVMAYLEQHG